jgi:large subunit ribosomal protein L3
MKGIIGRKVGMTQIFDENGNAIPVTVIEAGPCVVVQKRTKEKDGYEALQLGYQEITKSEEKIPKPYLGHFKKAGVKPMKILKEIKFSEIDKYNVGDTITVDIFQKGEKVDVTGSTKGRGFAGVMKRWSFGGFPKSHGHRYHRAVGAIGCRTYPGRVHPGKRMAGHYGVDTQTVKNLEIVDVIPEKNLILVKGSIPGHKNSIVVIKSAVGRSKKNA